MARLIDLAEEGEADSQMELGGEPAAVVEHNDVSYPNIGAFSAMLSCYPWVTLLLLLCATIAAANTTSWFTVWLEDTHSYINYYSKSDTQIGSPHSSQAIWTLILSMNSPARVGSSEQTFYNTELC